MPKKLEISHASQIFLQIIVRFWFFLSYLITTVDPYFVLFGEIGKVSLSKWLKKHNQKLGCHYFCACRLCQNFKDANTYGEASLA